MVKHNNPVNDQTKIDNFEKFAKQLRDTYNEDGNVSALYHLICAGRDMNTDHLENKMASILRQMFPTKSEILFNEFVNLVKILGTTTKSEYNHEFTDYFDGSSMVSARVYSIPKSYAVEPQTIGIDFWSHNHKLTAFLKTEDDGTVVISFTRGVNDLEVIVEILRDLTKLFKKEI